MIRTTSKAVLRRMLRRLDRQLAWWDKWRRSLPELRRQCFVLVSVAKEIKAIRLDARRREVREKLKEYKA